MGRHNSANCIELCACTILFSTVVVQMFNTHSPGEAKPLRTKLRSWQSCHKQNTSSVFLVWLLDTDQLANLERLHTQALAQE